MTHYNLRCFGCNKTGVYLKNVTFSERRNAMVVKGNCETCEKWVTGFVTYDEATILKIENALKSITNKKVIVCCKTFHEYNIIGTHFCYFNIVLTMYDDYPIDYCSEIYYFTQKDHKLLVEHNRKRTCLGLSPIEPGLVDMTSWNNVEEEYIQWLYRPQGDIYKQCETKICTLTTS